MRCRASLRRIAILVVVFLLGLPITAAASPLRTVATTPDLGDLLETIGGDDVDVEILVRGPADPHFVEPRPSFVRKLHRAELLLVVGLDLEAGWLPTLLRAARNPAIQPGQPGHLDASAAIVPLEVPTGAVDRSMGDVHPYGNPHYLLDPLNGLRVARAVSERLSLLRPGAHAGFDARYRVFAATLLERLVGPALAAGSDPEILAQRIEADELPAASLGGWLGRAQRLHGVKGVQDHRMWSYLLRRFGMVSVATLEPRPGIAPSTRHLTSVVEIVRKQEVPIVLSSPNLDPRHAHWVAEQSGARVALLAHQVGARAGTGDYLATIETNLATLLAALEAR